MTRLVLAGVLIPAAFVLGYAVRHYDWPPSAALHALHSAVRAGLSPAGSGVAPTPSVRWHPIAPAGPDDDVAAELDALGYLDGYEPAPDRSGARVIDPARTQPGPTLLLSGHAPGAELVDLEGRVLHRWTLPFEQACPDHPVDAQAADRRGFWHRALPVDGGGLLVVFDYLALARIDRDSRLVWSRCEPFHHDVAYAGAGRDRFVSLRRHPRTVEVAGKSRRLLDDEIVEVTGDGEEISARSVFDAVAASAWAPVLARIGAHTPSERGDHLHTNAVEALGTGAQARPQPFRTDGWLISIRNLDLVGVVDRAAGRLVWAQTGLWRRQHEPIVLDDGRLLVFDNEGDAGRSRVLEIDPTTLAVAWSYDGGAENGFTSGCCGMAQRLPNGNTLVTVTTSGHAFEVTPAGERVWEYWNPARAGPGDELIASLFRAIRLPEPETLAWLAGADAPPVP